MFSAISPIVQYLPEYLYAILLMALACFLGVYVATYLIEVGLARKIGKPLVPLIRVANLPEELSTPTIASILDIRAGHAIVSSMRRYGLSDEAIVAYSLVTRPIALLSFLFKFYLPVVVVALGLHLGLFYIALSVIASLVAAVIGIAYAKVKLKGRGTAFPPIRRENVSRKGATGTALRSAISIEKLCSP